MEHNTSRDLLIVSVDKIDNGVKNQSEWNYIVPELDRAYRSDDGRYVGIASKLYPELAAQLEKSLSDTDDDSSEAKIGPKHAPIGKQRVKYILNPGQNRIPPVIGEPDPEKFTIILIDTTNNKISWRHYQNVLGFDWNSKEDVKKLCKWRTQIFSRVAGQTRFRAPEDLWTVEEMTRLLEHTEVELGRVNGIWDNINWDVIADLINTEFADREFPRNTPVAAFKSSGENVMHQRKKLSRDRLGVTRTGAKIKEQAAELADMVELYETAQLALLPDQTDGQSATSELSGTDDGDVDMGDWGEGVMDSIEAGDASEMGDNWIFSVDQLDEEYL